MDPVTGFGPIDWVLGFLDTAGYPLVFGVTVLENIFVVGALTPGETIVMAAAFLSTPQHGSLSWPLVWLASVAGTTIGANISYWLGRRGGREALLRYGHRFRVSEKRIADAEAYFLVHGSKTIFIARFTAGLKSFMPMVAGAARMRLPWFEAYTVLGAALYTSLMVIFGYFLGENFERAMAFAAGLGYVGVVLLVALIVLIVVAYRRRRTRRKVEEELLQQLLEEELKAGDGS